MMRTVGGILHHGEEEGYRKVLGRRGRKMGDEENRWEKGALKVRRTGRKTGEE